MSVFVASTNPCTYRMVGFPWYMRPYSFLHLCVGWQCSSGAIIDMSHVLRVVVVVAFLLRVLLAAFACFGKAPGKQKALKHKKHSKGF
jgi:hypothetical protein